MIDQNKEIARAVTESLLNFTPRQNPTPQVDRHWRLLVSIYPEHAQLIDLMSAAVVKGQVGSNTPREDTYFLAIQAGLASIEDDFTESEVLTKMTYGIAAGIYGTPDSTSVCRAVERINTAIGVSETPLNDLVTAVIDRRFLLLEGQQVQETQITPKSSQTLRATVTGLVGLVSNPRELLRVLRRR